MALLAEEIVEEWLNRQGYFTIRGVKLGVQEIDLLAVRFAENGKVNCRHVEVQASMRPVSYISRVPKEIQKTGRAPNSAKRSSEELSQGVSEWIEKKFHHPDKVSLMGRLCSAQWSSELVVNVVKSEDELALIARHGITIIRLQDVVKDLLTAGSVVSSASGGDLIDLVQLGTELKSA